ncbi:TPA: hypothetical protein ACGHF0_003928 [Salmonella enterica subsp. enterica serovar Mississippi]|nr:hypothetical protein [Salmonella enterica subsp. enterica]ECW0837325.1 hypothetical protein [Salmonella enterica subsp. enterica]HEC7107866.1 hypothetical protein [Salmonella enterica subsp. enterica serovar Mississippi]
MSEMDLMGQENKNQGICSFTSMMYALYNQCPSLQTRLSKALCCDAPTRLSAEIKTFLRIMEANGNKDVLNSIENFTNTFGTQYLFWSEGSYITTINDSINPDGSVKKINYSIAMPPDALMVYIAEMWNGSPRIIYGDTSCPVGTIIGLGDASGLKHYVYKGLDGIIYSWGGRFDSIDKLQCKLDVQFYIHPGIQQGLF